jgi:Sec-independent protein secretion pathway component TatC
MGAPMYLLYEICIFVAWMMERKRKKEQDSLSG